MQRRTSLPVRAKLPLWRGHKTASRNTVKSFNLKRRRMGLRNRLRGFCGAGFCVAEGEWRKTFRVEFRFPTQNPPTQKLRSGRRKKNSVSIMPSGDIKTADVGRTQNWQMVRSSWAQSRPGVDQLCIGERGCKFENPVENFSNAGRSHMFFEAGVFQGASRDNPAIGAGHKIGFAGAQRPSQLYIFRFECE